VGGKRNEVGIDGQSLRSLDGIPILIYDRYEFDALSECLDEQIDFLVVHRQYLAGTVSFRQE
jgi:hypothetical protein